MTWSVDESYLINTAHSFSILTFRHRDCECTYRLSNCTKLFLAFVEVCPKRVQQSSLSMIDMTHDGDDWCSFFVLVFILCNQLNFKIHLKTHKLDCFVRKNLKLICANVIRYPLDKFKHVERLTV